DHKTSSCMFAPPRILGWLTVPSGLLVIHPGEQVRFAPIRGRPVRGFHEVAHGGARGDLPHDRRQRFRRYNYSPLRTFREIDPPFCVPIVPISHRRSPSIASVTHIHTLN